MRHIIRHLVRAKFVEILSVHEDSDDRWVGVADGDRIMVSVELDFEIHGVVDSKGCHLFLALENFLVDLLIRQTTIFRELLFPVPSMSENAVFEFLGANNFSDKA